MKTTRERIADFKEELLDAIFKEKLFDAIGVASDPREAVGMFFDNSSSWKFLEDRMLSEFSDDDDDDPIIFDDEDDYPPIFDDELEDDEMDELEDELEREGK